MAECSIFINGQQVLQEVSKDMLSMVGWSDDEDVKYCTKVNDKIIPVDDIKFDSDRYIGYMGDEEVAIAISANRNITIICNTQFLNLPELQDYDFFVKTFYISSILTELDLDIVNLTLHRVEEDYVHLVWELDDTTFEADISLNL